MADNNEEYLDITPEQKAEIDAIFNNKELLRCMGGLAYEPSSNRVDPPTPSEVKLKRMKEALKAFEENPPKWWDEMYYNG